MHVRCFSSLHCQILVYVDVEWCDTVGILYPYCVEATCVYVRTIIEGFGASA